MGHRSLRGDGSFSDTSAGQATELSVTSEQSITLPEAYSEPQWAVLTVDFHQEGPEGGEDRSMQHPLSLPGFPRSLSWQCQLGNTEAKRPREAVGIQCKNDCTAAELLSI